MAPFKRMRQPKMTTQALLVDFDLGEESSSDSDFRIEDHHNASDDDCSDASKDDDQDDSGDEDSSSDTDADEGSSAKDSDDSTQQLKQLLAGDIEPQGNGVDDLEGLLKQLDSDKVKVPKLPTKPICCVCLGDRSDDSNEIVECDGCGVSVHEGCYGVSDTASISSTDSTCSTEPWFCEACRAGVSEPSCELCPCTGGIYKETDVGKWVHLVCALYVPGVAFGEVDQLSSVTLFEMQYSKWGAKECSLCENSLFARTGVCIGCDAGMCKTYFHVTCAQAAGLLIEAHHDDADAADPFYAHCKLHSEKEMVKKRKRNFHTLLLNMQQKQREKKQLKLDDPCPAQMRIQRKLLKYQRKFWQHKQQKVTPWVPTQKMSRLLTTSASACKRLLAKAKVMSVDVELLERQETQIAALTDIRKKWHIAPAFSVEFVAYYLDRISRSSEMKQQLGEMVESNASLSKEQDSLRKHYDALVEKNKELKGKQESLSSSITLFHKHIAALCPNKNLPSPSQIGRTQHEPTKTATPPTRPISVPTAAALKMGVGFPLAHLGPPGTKVDATRLLSTQAKTTTPAATSHLSAPATPTLGVQTFECGICKRCTNQHLLAKCDTCKLHYHLGCLNPPLTRHPKKSKMYGWQCSECDKSDDSDATSELPKGPRKSRTRFNKQGIIVPVRSPEKPTVAPREVQLINKRRLSVSTATIAKKALVKVFSDEAARKGVQRPTGVPKPSKLSLSGRKEKTEASTKALPAKKAGAAATLPPVLQVVLPLTPISHSLDHMPASDIDPLALPITNTATLPSMDDVTTVNKQARKQKRKEKHRNKHNMSSDTDKSLNKEHKRKRKKKFHDHDAENPHAAGTTVPKIKIKFKTLPLPGEDTPEAKFFYVPADMVRSAEEGSRPTSVETVDDSTQQVLEEPLLPSKLFNTSPVVALTPAKVVPKRQSSPRKRNQRLSLSASFKTAAAAEQNLQCCVCPEPGSPKDVVTCDECRKNYHFTCLDPPLKKSPKIRGYSWHCAECDGPSEEEYK